TSIEALASLLASSGSAVCELAAAASVTLPPSALAGAVALRPNTASPSAASASAVQASSVPAAETVGSSQVQPAGAETARSSSGASSEKPAPGNWASSGPLLSTVTA